MAPVPRLSQFGNFNDAGKLAIDDLVKGIKLWRLWGKLGWNDILQRYRRSLLGPFWLTASMATMVVSLGIVYAQIFNIKLAEFIPFLCVGLLVWGFISSVLTEAGGLFVGSESYIKQIKLPYSLYVFKFIWSRTIIFAHNFLIYFAVILFFQAWPGTAVLLAIPGFIFLMLNCGLASLYIGMTSARFRDIPQIVGSVVQIIFFLTPIMWKPNLITPKSYLISLNPFFHLVEIVRAPLLGTFPTIENYIALTIITVVNFLVAGYFFFRFRSRISYWI